MWIFITLVIFSLFISFLITPWIIVLAEKLGIMQLPPTEILSDLKIEATDSNLRYKILALRNNLIKPPTAKWGGVAYTLAFFVVIFCIFIFDGTSLLEIDFSRYALWFLTILFLLIGGAYQDKYGGKAYTQLLYILLAAFLFALSPIDLNGVNILGHYLHLNAIHVKGMHNFISVVLPGDLIVILWTLFIFYAIKMQGGTDGLAEGNTVIALLFIAMVSLKFHHLQAAIFSFIWIGVLLGFLFYNFYPAYIFSGSSGKLVLGFVVASLAIISGAKLGTALIVFSIPLIDMVHVILQRIKKYKLYTRGLRGFLDVFAISDKMHLHHKLLKLGFKESSIAIFEYSITTIIGFITLYLNKQVKMFFLIVVWGLIYGVIKYINYLADKKHEKEVAA